MRDPWHDLRKSAPKAFASSSLRQILGFSLLALIAFLLPWLIDSQQGENERFMDFLSPEANAQYAAMNEMERERLALVNLPMLETLEQSHWKPTIANLTAANGSGTPKAVLDLGSEHTRLFGCRLNPGLRPPAGRCHDGFSFVPKERDDGTTPQPRRVAATLDFDLGHSTQAVTVDSVTVPIATATTATGQVEVLMDDLRVVTPTLRLPDPLWADQIHQVDQVESFSLLADLDIVSRAKVDYRLELPLPKDQGFLPLGSLTAETRIDLRAETPLFFLEGELTLLGNTMGSGWVIFVPGKYAAVGLQRVALPIQPPYLCLNLADLLLEADLENDRYRLSLTTVLGPEEALSCMIAPQQQNDFLKEAVKSVSNDLIATMRDTAKTKAQLDLEISFKAHGHIVVDLDQQVYCLDLGLQDHSLLNLSYHLKTGVLETRTPVESSTTLRTWADASALWNLGDAPLRIVPFNARHCWPGDPGPRDDELREKIQRLAQERGWAGGDYFTN